MASLNLVAPRFSALGIIEGLKYLQDEKNAEAERQLRLVQARTELARQRKVNIEATILQQTGLNKATAEVKKINAAAFQYRQAGEENRAQATSVPIKTAAYVGEKKASEKQKLAAGKATLINARSGAKVDAATVKLRNSQGNAAKTNATANTTRAGASVTTAQAAQARAASSAKVNSARVDLLNEQESVVKGKANAYIANQKSSSSINAIKAKSESKRQANALREQQLAIQKAEQLARCRASRDPNSADCKSAYLNTKPSSTKINRSRGIMSSEGVAKPNAFGADVEATPADAVPAVTLPDDGFYHFGGGG